MEVVDAELFDLSDIRLRGYELDDNTLIGDRIDFKWLGEHILNINTRITDNMYLTRSRVRIGDRLYAF
jgi:hypothetical protein